MGKVMGVGLWVIMGYGFYERARGAPFFNPPGAGAPTPFDKGVRKVPLVKGGFRGISNVGARGRALF